MLAAWRAAELALRPMWSAVAVVEAREGVMEGGYADVDAEVEEKRGGDVSVSAEGEEWITIVPDVEDVDVEAAARAVFCRLKTDAGAEEACKWRESPFMLADGSVLAS